MPLVTEALVALVTGTVMVLSMRTSIPVCAGRSRSLPLRATLLKATPMRVPPPALDVMLFLNDLAFLDFHVLAALSKKARVLPASRHKSILCAGG